MLLPNDPDNYYRALDIVTPEQLDRLQAATVLVTNFHAFLRREKIQAASLTKKVLAGFDEDDERFRETPAEMVRRVCRVFGNAKNIVVLNDEAHHCYAPAPKEDAEEGALDVDERTQAKKDLEEARVWLSRRPGRPRQARRPRRLRPLAPRRSSSRARATPRARSSRGSCQRLRPDGRDRVGHRQDPARAGQRRLDDRRGPDVPRPLAPRPRRAPAQGHPDTPIDGLPVIPKELEGALRSLYADYERGHQAWADAGMGTPPVFIVVCSNTATSKLVCDWIAGWEKELADGTERRRARATSPLFSNEQDGRFRDRPNTLLVDSAQLDRGDALDPAFRKAAAAEIERFKREYVARFPGRSADDITDEDILREVMNTVGKRGRLGEHIRCVVSVAMLTEGWDANTVTHILGIRAFGTQLLCEQVVGRALRRASYDPNADGLFEPEYAEVYGVPFSFLSVAGKGRVKVAKAVREVRALPERSDLRIEFPRLDGYRYEMPTDHLEATFDDSSILQLSTAGRRHPDRARPDRRRARHPRSSTSRDQRMQTVVFAVAKRTLDNHFRDDDGADEPWLFPQLVRITKRWIDECVTPYLKDGAFPQMLLFAEYSHAAADRHPPGDRGRHPRREAARARSSGRTSRSARPTTSGSRRPRPASRRPRATSTSSPRTPAGSRSSPTSSSTCPRSSATPRTRASTSRSRTPTRVAPATTSRTS